ncbi:recombinase [Phocaeicola faecium]|uniref:Recombinase n=1 Tax=Phocaeicola faecium TaxID=2762213 RepID=A0ABR8VEC0_9BACT|nr:recombinase [Phocaeicola faecium]MBD8003129.1 recombinase [Phocaeicola faecium]
MAQYSALRCVSGIWQNNEKPFISNGLRFIVTCLPTAALWVLFHIARHSFANIARQKKANVYDISKALGHSSLKITESYLSKFDTTSQDATMKQVFQNNTRIDENSLLKQLQSLNPEALASLLAKVNR